MPKVLAVQIQANIQWRTMQSTSSRRWIGVCDAMNLTMEADSLEELHSVIDETMQVVLTDLFQDNELEQYLQERGWQARNLPRTPTVRDIRFDVPWEMVTPRDARDSQRQAY